MDVRLSEEQQALRDAAAHVVDRLGPKAVRDIGDTDRCAKLDAAVGASGWRELRAPTEQGDPLASGVEAAIVAEELGRGLAESSFLGPTLAAELRRMTGVPQSDSVETVALSGVLESLARRPQAPCVVAVDTRGSTTALVVEPDNERYVLAMIEIDGAPGGPDLTRPSVVLSTPLTHNVEGARALAADDLWHWTAFGLALSCADLVGVMRGAVDLSCAYASQRQQYGATIGSFQAVQHMLADAHVLTEGARSITLHAAWSVDALPAEESLAAAAAAKAYCARAARTVCETAIQVHGGVGNTWDCLAHVFLRRALHSSEILGGASVSLQRLLEHRGLGV